MYLLAFAQFLMLGRQRIKQPHIAAIGWKKEDLDDMLFYGVLGVVIGGRLGQVLFYDPSYYFSHPAEIIAVWKGGMSFHGGFLGVLLAMAWWGRKAGRKLLDIMELIAPMLSVPMIVLGIVLLAIAYGRSGKAEISGAQKAGKS